MTTSTPLQGKTKIPAKKTPTMSGGKVKGKPNGNIMSFFKRAESSSATMTESREEDELLFLEDSPVKGGANMPLQTPTPPREEPAMRSGPEDAEMDSIDGPISRYNEDRAPSKRRRTDETLGQPLPIAASSARGPFADDSDSDGEPVKLPNLSIVKAMDRDEDCDPVARNTSPHKERRQSEKDPVPMAVPNLQRETTSVGEVNEFDGIEDFIDDEFPEEGEEYLERRWMEEQAEFEEGLEDEDEAMNDDTVALESKNLENTNGVTSQDAASSSCPICGGYTAGMNDQVCEHPSVLESDLTITRRYPFMSTTA